MRRGEATKVCPTCGRTLDERQWVRCPYCREPIADGLEPLPPAGMMTNFGLGLAAGIIAAVTAAAVATTMDLGFRGQVHLVLWPVGSGSGAALAAAWLGCHLIRPMRRSFERMVIAALFGVIPSAVFGLAVGNPWAAPGALTVIGALIYCYLRRMPADWGHPPERGAGLDSQPPAD